jgi:hypothetical protein
MAVMQCGTYDEVFKFKEHGTVDAHVWLMQETLEYIKERLERGKVITAIEYDDSNWQYYAFRITYA